jgi:hypothetical protein
MLQMLLGSEGRGLDSDAADTYLLVMAACILMQELFNLDS